AMEAFLAIVRHAIPGFAERPLTYDDFVACCRAEGIVVEVRPSRFDQRLSRRGRRPRITLNAGLTPLYKRFVAFHALGHWCGRPGNQELCLGSPGWLNEVELEASTVGFLAIAPWPHKTPYPRLLQAFAEGDEMQFWVRYPKRQPGGRVQWRTRK